jgi:hypothetical protein
VTNKVVAGGSPGTSTYYHRAVLLKSGAVLITGGRLSTTQKRAMLFVPSPGSWNTTVSMQTGRDMHAAARLQDGRVIVTGGEPGGKASYGQTSVEVYTP